MNIAHIIKRYTNDLFTYLLTSLTIGSAETHRSCEYRSAVARSAQSRASTSSSMTQTGMMFLCSISITCVFVSG